MKEFQFPPGDDETGGHRAGFPWTASQLGAAGQMVALVPQHRRHTAVQAGGNVGHMAYEFAQHFKNVITCEPDPQNFECLIRNLNGGNGNIKAANVALGEKPAQMRVRHNRSNSGASFVATDMPPVPVATEPVVWATVVPLDYLHLESCDLLQLDVEGMELPALKGAVNTIRMHQPLIILEINACCARYGYGKPELDKQLGAWDYTELKSHQLGNDHVYRHRSEL